MKKREIIRYGKRLTRLIREFKPQDLNKYVPHYDEMSLQEKVGSLLGVLGETVLLPVFKLYYVLQSKYTPVRKKLYIMGSLGYFILPMDIIPDFLPSIIGFTDDIVVISYVLKLVNDNLTPELERKAEESYRRLLHKKKTNLPTTREQ